MKYEVVPLPLDEATALAKVLKSLCILRKGQVLHVGGHAVIVR